MSHLVAIVGRANVGKSTLFNRLVGRYRAVVAREPGTTRDFLAEEVEWRGKTFTVVDTAGLAPLETARPKALPGHTSAGVVSNGVELEKDVLEQTEEAIESADLILFLVDAREGVQVRDKEAAEKIRKLGKPVILAVNKAESEAKTSANIPEFYQLGLGEPLAISAREGRGVGDLLDLVVKKLPKKRQVAKWGRREGGKERIKVAILGKPNVGKSTLFNRLLGKVRSVVSRVPGTTRDLINEVVEKEGLLIEFIDTGGLRRKAKIETGLELFSSLRSIRAMKEADLGLLLIDAAEGVSQQDKQILRYLLKEGGSVILVINKWDLIESEGKNVALWEREMKGAFHFAQFLPQIYLSALTGQRVEKLFGLIKEVDEARKTRFTPQELNNFFKQATLKLSPKAGRKPAKIYSAKQLGGPGIVIQLNASTESLDENYLRYLENRIREELNPLLGTPIFFRFKKNDKMTKSK